MGSIEPIDPTLTPPLMSQIWRVPTKHSRQHERFQSLLSEKLRLKKAIHKKKKSKQISSCQTKSARIARSSKNRNVKWKVVII